MAFSYTYSFLKVLISSPQMHVMTLHVCKAATPEKKQSMTFMTNMAQ